MACRLMLLDLAVRAGAWMVATGALPLDPKLVRAYAGGHGFGAWLRHRLDELGKSQSQLAEEALTSEKSIGRWLSTRPGPELRPRALHAKDLGAALTVGDQSRASAILETRLALALGEAQAGLADRFSGDVSAEWIVGFAFVANTVREFLLEWKADAWPVVRDGARAKEGAVTVALLSLAFRASSLALYKSVTSLRSDWAFATVALLRGLSEPGLGKRLHVLLGPLTARQRLARVDWTQLWAPLRVRSAASLLR